METNRPIKKEDVHARKLGDEWLLYDSKMEKVHILNPTAEYVWRLCDGNHDIATIKAKLRAVSRKQRLRTDITFSKHGNRAFNLIHSTKPSSRRQLATTYDKLVKCPRLSKLRKTPSLLRFENAGSYSSHP